MTTRQRGADDDSRSTLFERHTAEDVKDLPLVEVDKRLDALSTYGRQTAGRSVRRRQLYKVATYPAAVVTVGYGAVSGAGVLVAGGVDAPTAAGLLLGGTLCAAVARWWKPSAGQERNAVSRVRWQGFTNDVEMARDSQGSITSKRRALLELQNRQYDLKELDIADRARTSASSPV